MSLKKRKRSFKGRVFAGTMLATCASLVAIPVSVQAKVDNSTYEVEVHAESEDATLTDGIDITTDTGYGLGVKATGGHKATVNVGNVMATAPGYGRAVYAESRSGGIADLTLTGDVEIGGSGYVRGLTALTYGGATSVNAGNITNTIAGDQNGSSYGLYAGGSGDANNTGILSVHTGDISSASNGIYFSASSDHSQNMHAKIVTGNIQAADWNTISTDSGAFVSAGLGDVSSEKYDGLTVKAAHGGFTNVFTGKITAPKYAVSINAYGGSDAVVETKDLTSTGVSYDSGGIYAQGGSGQNGDFVMVNVDGNIYANGGGIIAGQCGKYLVNGDVTSVEADGLSLGDASGHTAVLITGTLSAGRNGVSGLSNEGVRNNSELTVWKITAEEEMFYGDDGTFAEKTNYIVKVKEGQEDLITVTKSDLSPLDKDFGYSIAHQGDRLRVTVPTSVEECKKYKAYNGTGADRQELPEDSSGYYLDVEKGGGIYLSVEEADDHDYTFKEMVWSGTDEDGYELAAGHFVCSRVSYHEKYQDATITENVTDPTCEMGGFTAYTATLTADKSIDGKEHTDTKTAKKTEATGHDWDAGQVTKDPTCSEEGEKTFTCKNDKLHTRTEKLSKDPDNHTWKRGVVTKDPTCTEKGEIKYTCANNESHFYTEDLPIDEDAHDWGEWTVVQEATELKSGTETRICKNNSKHTDSRDIPPLEHVHKLTKVSATEPTCTEDGNIEYWVCSDGENPCNKIFADADGTTEMSEADTIIMATGHDWDAGQVTKEPTCSEVGEKTFTCKNDKQHTKTEKLPKDPDNHTWKRGVVTKEPNCTEKGEIKYTCANNESHFYTEDLPIDEDAHDWGEWTVTKPATETEEGSRTRSCKKDPAHTETEVIPATTHEHGLTKVEAKDATCTEAGNIEYYICTEGEKPCGKLFKVLPGGNTEINKEDTVVPATGHTPGIPYKENEVAANCYDDGSYDEVNSCIVCGTELSRVKKTVPATGHDWGETVYTWKDDNSSVFASRTCKNPSESMHIDYESSDTTATVVKEPTCDEKGSTVYTAVFENEAFETQTKTVETDALGHSWKATTYVWSEDNSSVTATRKCGGCELVETETVTAESKIIKEPTETEYGEKLITGIFENGAFETQSKTVKIPKKTAEEISYRCISGDGNIWTKGTTSTSDFTFERSVDDDTTIDHYKCIYVNGSKVPDSGLAVESGSLKVSLKAEYLETLDLGTHTIKAEFDDGSAEAKFIVQAKAEPGNNNNQNNNNTSGDTKKTTPVTNTTGSRRNVVSAQGSNAVVVQSTTNKAVPKTGDNNMNALWILLTIIPAAAIAGMVIVRRKKTQE